MNEMARHGNAEFSDFLKLDIRVGTIVTARLNEKAKIPAYEIDVEFGPEMGRKKSSAQLTENYTANDLVGRQTCAVVNFRSKRVAGVKSEILILAIVCTQAGTVLVEPGMSVQDGGIMA